MKFYVSLSSVVQDAKNTSYPELYTVTKQEDLLYMAHFDHVGGKLTGGIRAGDNFIESDCIIMDCDNDMPNEDFVLTADKIEECFPDCAFCVVSSRSHLKEKNGLVRPRFHVYFPIATVADRKKYEWYKRSIVQLVPAFDANAIDATRLIFGNPEAEILGWHDGRCTILDYLEPDLFVEKKDDANEKLPEVSASDRSETIIDTEPILAGTRHMTLVRYAAKVLYRFGNTDESKRSYLTRASFCKPLLPTKEVTSIWESSLKWYAKKSKEPGYIPPLEYEAKKTSSFLPLLNYDEGNFRYLLKPVEYTDVGEAVVFYRRWKDYLKWTNGGGFWRWNGRVWYTSDQNALGCLLLFTKEQRKEALLGRKLAIEASKRKEPDAKVQEEVAESYLEFVNKRRMYKGLLATEKVFAAMVEVDESIFDSEANIINTPEGCFFLDENKEIANDPNLFMTKITRKAPSNKGQTIWQDFLDKVYIHDDTLIDYVQQIVGLCLWGAIKQEALIICYGSGANGKSTFWNTIAEVLGNYSGNLSAEVLTTSKQRNTMPEIAELKGKRLVIAAELEEGQRLSTSMLKKLCSADSIIAERKYYAPFSFKPSHTVVLYTNFLPKIGAMDRGTWRRIILLPFLHIFKGEDEKKDYSSILYTQAGEYVLQWAIDGARKIAANNFVLPQPQVVIDAIKSYKDENDWLKKFLDSCCNIGSDLLERRSKLYQVYKDFSVKTNEYVRRNSDFYNALENAGFIQTKIHGERCFRGILLKDDIDVLIAGLELKARYDK